MKLFRSLLLFSTSWLIPSKALAAGAKVSETGGFAQLSELTVVFANVCAVIATFAGFAVLFMLISGGVSYITAQGDPKAVTAARSKITWSIVGMIVIISAYLIVSLIAGFVAVPGLGKFCLPTAGSNAATFCQVDK